MLIYSHGCATDLWDLLTLQNWNSTPSEHQLPLPAPHCCTKSYTSAASRMDAITKAVIPKFANISEPNLIVYTIPEKMKLTHLESDNLSK